MKIVLRSLRFRSILACLAAVTLFMLPPGHSGQQPKKDGKEKKPPLVSERVSVVDPVAAKLLERRKDFDHGRLEHKKQNCDLCHARKDNSPAAKFPVHDACIDCHARDFNSPTSVTCAMCHKIPIGKQNELIPFPTHLKQFLTGGFSHKDHLDPKKMSSASGVVPCWSCHQFDARGLKETLPQHPNCYSCHTHQAGEQLGRCRTCHTPRQVPQKAR